MTRSTHKHHSHHAAHLLARAAMPQPRPAPIPLERLNLGLSFDPAGTLEKRTPPGGGGTGSSSGSSSDTSSSDSFSDTSSSSTSSSTTSSSSSAKKPSGGGGSDSTIPIVVGVIVPICVLLALMFFLHRRHLKKLKQEDAKEDVKHGSLDFGMPTGESKWKKQKMGKNDKAMALAEAETEKTLRRGRGMSMDMGSPYLLPPGLQSSRESLHSLSRSMHSTHDPYRPATTFVPTESYPNRSYPNSPRGQDNLSMRTGSSVGAQDSMNQELLKNASRMSRSSPPQGYDSPRTDDSAVNSPIQMPPPVIRKGLPSNPRPGNLAPPAPEKQIPRDSYIEKDGGDMRRSNNYLGAFINTRDSVSSPDHAAQNGTPKGSPPPSSSELDHAARHQSPPLITETPPPADVPSTTRERPLSMQVPVLEMPTEGQTSDDGNYHQNSHAYQQAITGKPLPADPSWESHYDEGHYQEPQAGQRNWTSEYDHPPQIDMAWESEFGHSHSGEAAAGGLTAPNMGYDRRISMGVRPLPPDDPSDDPEQRANRIRSFYKEYFDDSKPGPFREGEAQYEDFGHDYLGDAAYYDPDNGGFVVGGAPYAEPVTRRAMTPPPRAPPRFRGPPRSNGSSMSGLMPPGPRAFSSASGRIGGAGMGARGRPIKPMPPPTPLRVLPTPHMLKEDAFALPIEFAPPTTYRDRQAGRPESPLGGLRPYTPAIPAHMPLVSSFDDLSVMPSPHALRKSGTFTGLDFAPPPRFKNADSASDAGSIRSNKSGMSAAQLHSIRAGAYRISRIPKDVVGTKAELTGSLRPTWDMK